MCVCVVFVKTIVCSELIVWQFEVLMFVYISAVFELRVVSAHAFVCVCVCLRACVRMRICVYMKCYCYLSLMKTPFQHTVRVLIVFCKGGHRSHLQPHGIFTDHKLCCLWVYEEFGKVLSFWSHLDN